MRLFRNWISGFAPLLGVLGLGSAPSTILAGQPRWLNDQFLKIHMELNVPNRPNRPVGERFDVKAFREAVRASGAQVVTIFAKDAYGNSFFRTRHGYFDPGLKFDLVKAQIDALHTMGIKVLTHYSSGDDSHIDLFHPDWLCEDINGKPFGGVISNRACFNSPYREEMLLPQLEEIARLEVDGLWLDIFLPPEGCFCRHCRRRFREKYQAELSPTEPRRFRFWTDSLDEVLVGINRRMRAINPNIAITHNFSQSFSSAKHGLVDFFTVESHVNKQDGYDTHHLQARYLRPLGIPFDVQNMTNVERWDDSTLKSPGQLELEFSQIMAQGGRVAAGTQLYPWGEYDEKAARVLGEAFGFMKARIPYAVNARQVRYAALLLPDGMPADGTWRFTPPPLLVGTARALSQLHLQFDILHASNGGSELLPDYKLAIVLDLASTFHDNAAHAAMERFLTAGGKLLMISSGQVVSPELLTMLGVDLRSGVRKSARGNLRSRYRRLNFPFDGDVLTLEGQSISPIVSLHTPGEEVIAAGLIGKQAAYIAWPFGQTYYQTGYPEWRGFLQDVLAAMQLELPYRIEGAPNLEVNLMERSGEYLLHLVNTTVQRGLPGLMPSVWDVPPMHQIPVTLRCPHPSSISLEPSGTNLPFTYDGSAVHFNVPTLQLYEIACIHYERAAKVSSSPRGSL